MLGYQLQREPFLRTNLGNISKTYIDHHSPHVSIGSKLEFDCSGSMGALAVVGAYGVSECLIMNSEIENYILHNYTCWFNFVRTKHNLAHGNLMFVQGTTKTSKWTIATYKKTQQAAGMSVSASAGNIANFNFSVSADDQHQPSYNDNHGPKLSQLADEDLPFNQCMFAKLAAIKRHRMLYLSNLVYDVKPEDVNHEEENRLVISRGFSYEEDSVSSLPAAGRFFLIYLSGG